MSYLVIIEVKNRKRRASASDVEAFITKANDQRANKIVFVTWAGFQSGAIEVAKRHGVDLFTLNFKEDAPGLQQGATYITKRRRNAPSEPLTLRVTEKILAAWTEQARLTYVDGSTADVPSEITQMTYYMKRSRLSDGRTLENLVPQLMTDEIRDGTAIQRDVWLDPPLRLDPPDDLFFPPGVLKSVRFTITGRMTHFVEGNVRIDPTALVPPIEYTNVLTGEVMHFNIGSLPLGVKRVEAGKFYFNEHPLRYYYCDLVEGDQVVWKLVESFQSNELVRWTANQNIKYSYYYIEVTDERIVKRLRERLRRYDELVSRDKQ